MQTLSPQFYGRLNNNLQTGVIEQHDNINAIKGKILLYSLALQFGLGSYIPSGFEINDISIVYRMKKPK